MKKVIGFKADSKARVFAYLSLLTLIAGDSMFAEDYLRPSLIWFAWLALALVSLAGAIYFFLRADWRRVIGAIPVELVLLLALMIGSAPWSAYAQDTVSGFALQLGVVAIALFFVAVF